MIVASVFAVFSPVIVAAAVFFALLSVCYATDGFFCYAYLSIRGTTFNPNDQAHPAAAANNSPRAIPPSMIGQASTNIQVGFSDDKASTYEQSYPVY
ncbi:hypothetical protein Ciccas_008077 [Cichlidogyrus casuarinus]|uniref:Uncharacterized protein n=1 Tax=Cichlidogyrus casuarinus TaxID=1844966 RepID=A0ABD2Q0Z9_9PLAT